MSEGDGTAHNLVHLGVGMLWLTGRCAAADPPGLAHIHALPHVFLERYAPPPGPKMTAGRSTQRVRR